MSRFIIALLLTVSVLSQYCVAQPGESGVGDDTLIDDRPPPVKLMLFPTPEPRIAFEHHLMLQPSELIDGDAAVFYMKAKQLFEAKRELVWPLYNEISEDQENDDGVERPISEFPIAKAKQFLALIEKSMDYIRYASVRKTCNWAFPFKDNKDRIIDLDLLEVNDIRVFAWFLKIEAQVALYENRPLDALKSVKTGFAMARHISTGPFLIQGLVGVSVHGIMCAELWEIMQHPDCPNLYWVLTELPKPGVEFQSMFAFEFEILYNMVPEMRRVEKEQLAQEEYNLILQKLFNVVKRLEKEHNSNPSEKKLTTLADKPDLASVMPELYASARAKLLAAGFSTEDVNKMGTAEAIVKQVLDSNKAIVSEMSKVAYLADNEVPPFLDRHLDMQFTEFKKLETLPFGSILLPANRAARIAYARASRRIATLRTFEAIRMHIDKTKKLPAALNEITIVPLPKDPLLDRPFDYQFLSQSEKQGQNKKPPHNESIKAMLTSPGLSPWGAYDALRYEITLLTDKNAAVKQLAADKVAFQAKLAAQPPKPKVEPKKPDPRDEQPVVTKDQKYYEPVAKDDKERVAKQFMNLNQSVDNMKQIMLAMMNHVDAKKTYPAAYIADKDGKPLLSWRVMILPYIEEKALYEKFKLDEPWDSEHNKKLISMMPKVYANPLMKPLEHGKTCYLAAFGKETIFTGATGTKIRQVPDGTSKTIALVEAAPESAVEWTKPQDWNFDSTAKEPFKGLFGLRESGLLVGICDGSVGKIKPTETRGAVKGLLTKAGGENIKINLRWDQ